MMAGAPNPNQRENRTTKSTTNTPTVAGVPISVVPKAGQSYTPVAKPTTPSTQTLNLYGSPASIAATTPAPVVTKKTGGSNIPAPKSREQVAADAQAIMDKINEASKRVEALAGASTSSKNPIVPRTVATRIPRYDNKGRVIGYDLVYSDGSAGFEPNASYGLEEEEVKGTTNVQVLKSVLLARGFPSSLVDASTTFLQTLLKEGIDDDAVIEIFLNSKDFTTKNGSVITSPFYSSYGFYNDALTEKYSAKDLFNTIEGYKETKTKYGVSDKFVSQEYIQKYLKNNRSVASLDAGFNKARLQAIQADPSIVYNLQQLGYITNSQDLTDFYADPNVGMEKMRQNYNTAALSLEAVRRANKDTGIEFNKSNFEKLGAGLTAQGFDESQVQALSSKSYDMIGQTLLPTLKLSNIYEKDTAATKQTIQSELEQEQFNALESRRRKKVEELEKREFQTKSGLSQMGLSTSKLY